MIVSLLFFLFVFLFFIAMRALKVEFKKDAVLLIVTIASSYLPFLYGGRKKKNMKQTLRGEKSLFLPLTRSLNFIRGDDCFELNKERKKERKILQISSFVATGKAWRGEKLNLEEDCYHQKSHTERLM